MRGRNKAAGVADNKNKQGSCSRASIMPVTADSRTVSEELPSLICKKGDEKNGNHQDQRHEKCQVDREEVCRQKQDREELQISTSGTKTRRCYRHTTTAALLKDQAPQRKKTLRKFFTKRFSLFRNFVSQTKPRFRFSPNARKAWNCTERFRYFCCRCRILPRTPNLKSG